MKSYDIVEWGQPLQIVLRDTPQPQGTEVLVEVQACGVCHTDLHIREGSLDLGNGKRVSFESLGVRLTLAARPGPTTAVTGRRCRESTHPRHPLS
jgi:alcohol dehydrogenase, propanol-preferring